MARNRNVQIIFWVSENEKSMIEEKMAQAGMSNLSAYLRRIAIDGMIVRLELPELTAFLEQRGLERHKLPELLVALEELPLAPTGKVCRRTVSAIAAERAGAR